MFHQLSANAYQFSAENAINSGQDLCRVQGACSSIEHKYFGKLPVEQGHYFYGPMIFVVELATKCLCSVVRSS